ncbi:MAG: glycosyltransferase family 4 protein, partial [Gammaproteobacteria bacterium]
SVSDKPIGDSARFFFASRGHEVHAITGRQLYGDSKANLPDFEIINKVRVRRVWSSSFGRYDILGRFVDYLTFYVSSGWSLYKMLRVGDVVIAKTDPPLLSVVSLAAARVRGAAQINWLQDLFPEVASNLGVWGVSFIERGIRSLRNMSLRGARYNVVIGNLMAQRLRSEGISDKAIRVIPNWADGSRIRPIARENNVLVKEWNLQGRFIVCYSGNMGRAHEFNTITGAAELLKLEPTIVFVFIGDGVQRQPIAEAVKRRNLPNVILKPYQPRDLLAYSLGLADVHLISLRPELEGLIVPSKFYGIAAAGKPTIYIGDQAGEIPELLRREGCGFAVSVGDERRLAARIGEIYTNVSLKSQMGQKARTLFECYYEKTVAMAKWERLINTNGPEG